MLSAIAQRLSGMRLLDYLQPRLFAPLGIAHPTWDTSPQGIDMGGTGMYATTAAIARFGQLYLQKGLWHGERLLPEGWVEEATARQVDNAPSLVVDWEQGYGYQFWRCRHGAYRGDGAFGQFCLVMPDQDAVLAITAGMDQIQMQEVLDLVWEHLLPAFGPAPLPDDPAAHEALAARLAGLHLPMPRGQRTCATAQRLAGRTFAIAPNDEGVEAFSLSSTADGSMLTLRNRWGLQQIPCGYGTWVPGTAAIERPDVRDVAASGAWTDEQTYAAQLWWYKTPFGRTLTCHFDGDRVTVEQRVNVWFGSTDRPHLEGRISV